MNNYIAQDRKSPWKKVLTAFAIALVLLLAGSAIVVRRVYQDNLKPLSSSEKSHVISIPVGSTPREIAIMLEKEGVIRKSWAFEWYVRSHGVRQDLKAGTYALKPSQSIADIVVILTHGRVATDLVTVYPAKRIDEVRDDLINQGFNADEVDAALNPALYADHPALVDKPRDASLEGYLYPESFEKIATTKAQDIVRSSLDQMQLQLTPAIREDIVRQGLTVHEGVILASIIEQEVGSKDPQKDIEDKKKVAQVFLRRIREGMPLQSDATADYGAILAGEEPRPGYESPYNTYLNKGLTPGPISNVGKNSLQAVSSPAETDFLYFVSGDNGVNYFSRTLPEHENLVREHCKSCL